MAGTYGSSTYGGGDYGPDFGGPPDLTLEGTGAIVVSGALVLSGGGGELNIAAAIVVSGAMVLSGGGAAGGIGAFVFTATLALGKTLGLYPEPAVVRFSGGLDLPPSGTGRRWLVVEPDGEPLGELENAVAGPITWSLNKPDEWSCTIGVDDPKAPLVHDERFREVQVWRGDMLLTWGPIVRPTQDLDRLQLVGRDCLWYFGRRHIGKAERTNYMLNPSFEDGLAHWNIGYGAPVEFGTEGANPAYVLSAVSSARAINGSYSARIETPSDTYPLYGAVAFQPISWTATARDGDIWTASIWLYIPSATLRSLDGANLSLARYNPADTTPVYNLNGDFVGNFPKVIEMPAAPITPDFPLDKWHKLEVTLTVPPTGITELVQFQVAVPKGVTFLEDARLTYNERLEFFATDQALIAEAIVEHLQDPAFDKNDLNIGTACPLTGVLRDATYLFEEHLNGGRALEDFTKLDDGFDHRIDYTATTRTYTFDYPASGRWRPRVPLQLAAEVVDYRWTFDGELAASAVVTLGQGSGSGRVEGFAGDTTAYANGLILEEVFAAPPGAPVTALDNLAAERLAVTTSPEILEFTTNPDPDLTTKILGGCRVGDVVPVTLRRGELTIEGTRWRLVRLTLNPDDSMSGTLNRRDVTA